ncbi:hypothetical protein Ddye_011541 [Dipteronia dyeriana]|uniref:NB-ARC domain-containing protein n=1 Tax=Dipteronia dyeriana TaxID=168575 RepID=A0AAE0CH64_9ROSI|nr:hypothetical protein Ddye_011541 [Dipteronia dyeriana]
MIARSKRGGHGLNPGYQSAVERARSGSFRARPRLRMVPPTRLIKCPIVRMVRPGTSSSLTSTSACQRPQTTSVTTKLSVYGRDEDAAKLLEMVLSDHGSSTDTKFSVISIVGMGRIGKTTLARKVYNDTTIKDFYLKVWAYVSDDFDVFRISKAILESIIDHYCDLKDLNAVHIQLEREVSGRKFLLVLDDVCS